MANCVKCWTNKRPSKVLETAYAGKGWVVQIRRCSNCGLAIRTPIKTKGG